jgi:hypothetical protein
MKYHISVLSVGPLHSPSCLLFIQGLHFLYKPNKVIFLLIYFSLKAYINFYVARLLGTLVNVYLYDAVTRIIDKIVIDEFKKKIITYNWTLLIINNILFVDVLLA